MNFSVSSRAYAPYACHPAESRGRLYQEPESNTRSPFQRDRDRIIHSAAFRRLKHKTQVFVYHEGDHYRTRLTHSLEVSQIARSVARVLGLDEDLAEALALAHDLGHPPFGHSGEDALNAAMADFGGFDHNAQTLRVLTALEQRYADFDGLNMTWETLEGVVKHNGPLRGPLSGSQGGPVAQPVLDYCKRHDLELDGYPGVEAQVASLADDIAYNNHDIDDGLRAGLFDIDDLAELPLVGPVLRDVKAKYPDLARPRLIHETVRRMINLMICDLIDETKRRIEAAKPSNVSDIRALNHPVAMFSEEMSENDQILKNFLRQNMYRHYKVNRMGSKAKRVVTELVGIYMAEPEVLPVDWRPEAVGTPNSPELAHSVRDFIAGMTDRFALDEHRRLFDMTNNYL